MIGGARKSREIWNAIRKADFRKEGILNEANINLVFEKCKEIIYDLLRVTTQYEQYESCKTLKYNKYVWYIDLGTEYPI